MATGGTEESVRVYVRVRPLSSSEEGQDLANWTFGNRSVKEETTNGQRVYSFDRCFGPEIKNRELYEAVAQPLVTKVMEGFNATLFTYGQSGSGKTWTMKGSSRDPGILLLCMKDMVTFKRAHPETDFTFKVSYIEVRSTLSSLSSPSLSLPSSGSNTTDEHTSPQVYNEEINDLLAEGESGRNLKITADDIARGVVIQGLTEHSASSMDDFMRLLAQGESSKMGDMVNGSDSTRSHTIYRIGVEITDHPTASSPRNHSASSSSLLSMTDSSTPSTRMVYLNLVDLAGSEKAVTSTSSNATAGVTSVMKGGVVNRSLLALSSVIQKLSENAKKRGRGTKPNYVPYRESKLTRLLKPSLGGNTYTAIMCVVAPLLNCRDESVSTLKFGQICRSIKNTVRKDNTNSSTNMLSNDDSMSLSTTNLQSSLRTKEIDSLNTSITDLIDKGGNNIYNRYVEDFRKVVRILETFILSKDISVVELNSFLGAPSNETLVNIFGSHISRLSGRLEDQEKELRRALQLMKEYGDLESGKQAFDEYESQVRLDFEAKQLKLSQEEARLHQERENILRMRLVIDEREARLMSVVSTLDNKESRLRQLQATLREQNDEWKRTIADLKRREERVNDWQQTHEKREKQLESAASRTRLLQEELTRREELLNEQESKQRLLQRELTERDHRSTTLLAKLESRMKDLDLREEELEQKQRHVTKRENDCILHENENLNKRRELEIWDSVLNEKERRLSADTRLIDEKENASKQQEERLAIVTLENTKRSNDLTRSEADLKREWDAFARAKVELDKRSHELDTQYSELRDESLRVASREQAVAHRESKLAGLNDYARELDAQQNALTNAIHQFRDKQESFYTTEADRIVSHHTDQQKRLHEIFLRQFSIVRQFVESVSNTRTELSARSNASVSDQLTDSQRWKIRDDLKDRLYHLDNSVAGPADQQLEDRLDRTSPEFAMQIASLRKLAQAFADKRLSIIPASAGDSPSNFDGEKDEMRYDFSPRIDSTEFGHGGEENQFDTNSRMDMYTSRDPVPPTSGGILSSSGAPLFANYNSPYSSQTVSSQSQNVRSSVAPPPPLPPVDSSLRLSSPSGLRVTTPMHTSIDSIYSPPSRYQNFSSPSNSASLSRTTTSERDPAALRSRIVALTGGPSSKL